MFVNALEIVGGFTRPIFTIARRYGTSEVDPGSATLFFVNDEGWAVTTRKVAQLILEANNIEKKYAAFREERSALLETESFEDELRVLEIKYGYTDKHLAQMKVNFFDCVDSITGFECKMSNQFDLAAIKLSGWNRLLYKGHAIFAADGNMAKPGKYLCRVGYPFPEFKNYTYDPEKDDIVWTSEGIKSSPRFPVDGMVTRLISDGKAVAGIELSTGGLRGLNGGPLFDTSGTVYGMQIGLGKMNLGHCLHAEIIKGFLAHENIPFYVASKTEPVKLGSAELLYADSPSARMS